MMKDKRENRPTRPEPNPILIQSYFDGELESDELEALSLEEIKSHPMLEALAELREVVRYDSQQALEGIDDMALLNAIHRQIASEKQITEVPKVRAHKKTSSSRLDARIKRHAHWAPAFVGAVLLLLSLPGLAIYFSKDKSVPANEHGTVACIEVIDNGQSSDLVASDSPTPHTDYDKQLAEQENPTSIQVLAPSPRIRNHDDQQLTVQEMDFAIRHLIDRIESLENANRNPYDSADFGLAKPAFNSKHNEANGNGQKL